MATDEVLSLPKKDRKLLVLTRHGWPDTPGDPYPELARVYYWNLKAEVEKALEGTNTLVVYADTDFAGEADDKKHNKLASFEALEYGLEEKYDHIIFVMVDFTSENTDTIFAMRLKLLSRCTLNIKTRFPMLTGPNLSELSSREEKIFILPWKTARRKYCPGRCSGRTVGSRYRQYVFPRAL